MGGDTGVMLPFGRAVMVDVVIVAWHILSLLEDAFYSFSFKALDMLMLKLQDGVSSHDLCADVMLFLIHHQ